MKRGGSASADLHPTCDTREVSTPGLFDDDDSVAATKAPAPLAERVRPRTLDELIGQEHLLAPGKPLREAIDADVLQSIILWGPPGTGKTSIARLLADVAGGFEPPPRFV